MPTPMPVFGPVGRGCGGHAARRRPARSAPGRRRPRRCCGPRRAATRSRTCPRRVWPGTRCTASTAAQRTSREPCLVIRPRCTVVSDSWCLGVSPAQEASCVGPGNRVTSPISATNTAGQHRPDPGDGLDRLIAGMGARAGRRPAWRTTRSRSPGRRSAAAASRSGTATRSASGDRGEQPLPGHARTDRSSAPCTPAPASTAVDLAFQARPQPDQLGPVPHQLAQLPGGRRRDPRLGQPAHPQQIRQIRARRARLLRTRKMIL